MSEPMQNRGGIWSRPAPGDFGPSLAGHLIVVFVAWLTATICYAAVISWCYRGVYRAYREANVFGDLFAGDPGTDWVTSASGIRWLPETETSDGRKRILFRSLQLAGLVSAEESSQRNSIPRGAAELLFEFAASEEQAKYFQRGGSTVEMIVAWAQLVPDAQKRWTLEGTPLSTDAGFREWTADRIGAALAQQPEALDEYRAISTSPASAGHQIARMQGTTGDHFHLILFHPLDGRAYFPGATTSPAELLNLIYIQTKLTTVYGALAPEPNPPAKDRGPPAAPEALERAVAKPRPSFQNEDFQFLSAASVELLSRVHANSAVRNERWYLTMFLGPEQYVMTFLFSWMLFLMGVRSWRRVRVEEPQKVVLLRFLQLAFRDGVPANVNRRIVETRAACVLLAFSSDIVRNQHVTRLSQERPRRPPRPALVKLVPPVVPERTRYASDQEFEKALDACRQQEQKHDEKETEHQNRIAEYKAAMDDYKRDIAAWIDATNDWIESLRSAVNADSLAQTLAMTVRRELVLRRDKATTQPLKDRSEQADDAAYRSRWIIRWIAKSLPALGFIGTVRGMLLALGNADSIVRATTQATRAAAITEVAGQLGIAFTTTFVALLMGLVTSYINDHQAASESELIGDLESGIKPLLDPSAGI